MRAFFLIAAAALILTGCEPSTSNDSAKSDSTKVEAPKTDAAKGAVPGISDAAKGAVASAISNATKAEIACAHCVYHVEGVTSCQPAVKVGGQTLLLTGAAADVAKGNAELCKAPKSVTLDGKIDGKSFVASKVEIAK
jgi:PBP1b-binding outer membrane lipoprotein LpoB